MNWEELKGQLEDAVKEEAVKVLDEAISRLLQLKQEYLDEQPAGGSDSPSVPQEQVTQALGEPEKVEIKPPTTRKCKVCDAEFIPTHGLQKKCLEHRIAPESRPQRPTKGDRAGSEYEPKGVDDGEWRAYGEAVAAKIAKRPEAQLLPRTGDDG